MSVKPQFAYGNLSYKTAREIHSWPQQFWKKCPWTFLSCPWQNKKKRLVLCMAESGRGNFRYKYATGLKKCHGEQKKYCILNGFRSLIYLREDLHIEIFKLWTVHCCSWRILVLTVLPWFWKILLKIGNVSFHTKLYQN